VAFHRQVSLRIVRINHVEDVIFGIKPLNRLEFLIACQIN
jgi:hypothetical protein